MQVGRRACAPAYLARRPCSSPSATRSITSDSCLICYGRILQISQPAQPGLLGLVEARLHTGRAGAAWGVIATTRSTHWPSAPRETMSSHLAQAVGSRHKYPSSRTDNYRSAKTRWTTLAGAFPGACWLEPCTSLSKDAEQAHEAQVILRSIQALALPPLKWAGQARRAGKPGGSARKTAPPDTRFVWQGHRLTILVPPRGYLPYTCDWWRKQGLYRESRPSAGRGRPLSEGPRCHQQHRGPACLHRRSRQGGGSRRLDLERVRQAPWHLNQQRQRALSAGPTSWLDRACGWPLHPAPGDPICVEPIEATGMSFVLPGTIRLAATRGLVHRAP